MFMVYFIKHNIKSILNNISSVQRNYYTGRVLRMKTIFLATVMFCNASRITRDGEPHENIISLFKPIMIKVMIVVIIMIIVPKVYGMNRKRR